MALLIEVVPKPRLPYVQKEKSRKGEPIWYVRVGDGPRERLRAAYGSAEFVAEYWAARKKLEPCKPSAPGAPQPSLRWLWDAYRHSADWKRLGPSTQRARDNIMKHVLEKAGNMPFKAVTRGVIKRCYDDRADTPAAARVFVIIMRGMFRWALEAEHMDADPTRDVRAPAPPTDGHHTWTAEEIAKFEKTWPRGTRERLAFDVLLYTGLRRGDAARVGRQHVANGTISIRTEKTDQEVDVVIHPDLWRSLDAGPCGDLAFIVGDSGHPMTKESFGNWFGEVCAKTGVPGRAHGLRKALAVKFAESGAQEREMDAAMGWSGGGMAALYTRKASRRLLSSRAHARLVKQDDEE